MFGSAFVMGRMSLIPIIGSIIGIIGFYFLFFGLWSGFHVYMNKEYEQENPSFGDLFNGFSFSGRIILSLLIRMLLALPLLAFPYYMLFASTSGLQENISSMADPREALEFYQSMFGKSTFLWSYISIMVISQPTNLSY